MTNSSYRDDCRTCGWTNHVFWWDGNGSKLQFQKKQNKTYSAFQPSILGSITLSCISPFPSVYTCCWWTMAFISWKTYLTRPSPMIPLQVGLRRSIPAPGRKGPRRWGLWETGQKIMIMQGTSAYVWAVKGWEEGRCEYILILQGANPKQTSFHALFDSQCRTTVERSCETHMHKRNIYCISTHIQWTNTCHIWWICLALWLWVVHSIHRTCNLHLTLRKQKVLITYHLLIGTKSYTVQIRTKCVVGWSSLYIECQEVLHTSKSGLGVTDG